MCLFLTRIGCTRHDYELVPYGVIDGKGFFIRGIPDLIETDSS